MNISSSSQHQCMYTRSICITRTHTPTNAIQTDVRIPLKPTVYTVYTCTLRSTVHTHTNARRKSECVNKHNTYPKLTHSQLLNSKQWRDKRISKYTLHLVLHYKKHKMNYFNLVIGIVLLAFCVEKGKSV